MAASSIQSCIVNLLTVLSPCRHPAAHNMQVDPKHLSNKPGSEEVSLRTNDFAEFISFNHFSNTIGWTGQPIRPFKTKLWDILCQKKSEDNVPLSQLYWGQNRQKNRRKITTSSMAVLRLYLTAKECQNIQPLSFHLTSPLSPSPWN